MPKTDAHIRVELVGWPQAERLIRPIRKIVFIDEQGYRRSWSGMGSIHIVPMCWP